ncbi:MAG: hypothetical protein Q8N63_02930 [Nanoarchaeota archaeon]|nr:hypothetical protein [Nanoarchaeota archaeon]
MQNEKGYALANVGNDIRSTKTAEAIMVRKLRGLKPGNEMFITSISVYESGLGRLVQYARDLGQSGGFSIGPNGQTDYYYSVKNLPYQTQLFIGRNYPYKRGKR